MINEVKKETWKRKSSGAIIEVLYLHTKSKWGRFQSLSHNCLKWLWRKMGGWDSKVNFAFHSGIYSNV